MSANQSLGADSRPLLRNSDFFFNEELLIYADVCYFYYSYSWLFRGSGLTIRYVLYTGVSYYYFYDLVIHVSACILMYIYREEPPYFCLFIRVHWIEITSCIFADKFLTSDRSRLPAYLFFKYLCSLRSA